MDSTTHCVDINMFTVHPSRQCHMQAINFMLSFTNCDVNKYIVVIVRQDKIR